MKAIKIFLAVFSFAVLSGCKKEYSFEDEVKCKIEEDVKNICADVNAKERTKALFNLISYLFIKSFKYRILSLTRDETLCSISPPPYWPPIFRIFEARSPAWKKREPIICIWT